MNMTQMNIKRPGGEKMRKSVLILATTMLFVFGIATSAMAAITNYVHMNFSTTDNAGCAACHVAHAANAPKLLKGGDGTQKGACYACHNNGQSPFDASKGRIAKVDNYSPLAETKMVWDAANYNPSPTGGFDQTYDWTDADGDTVTDEYLTSTSAHNVEGISLLSISGGLPADKYTSGHTTGVIPGGSVKLGDTFRCGSCHDPHNYDSAAGAGNIGVENPRLLKKTLPDGAATNHEPTIAYDDLAGGTNKATQYNVNINAWCAGCHNWLNQANDSGHTAVNVGGTNKYMHAMGVKVDTGIINAGTIDYASGYAFGVNGAEPGVKDKLICLSCHRVHGTAAKMTGDARSYSDVNGYIMGGLSGNSALLRFNDRGVCYNCHESANLNGKAVGDP